MGLLEVLTRQEQCTVCVSKLYDCSSYDDNPHARRFMIS